MHHDRIEIDTSISVIVVSPTTWEAHQNDLNLGINSYNSLRPRDYASPNKAITGADNGFR